MNTSPYNIGSINGSLARHSFRPFGDFWPIRITCHSHEKGWLSVGFQYGQRACDFFGKVSCKGHEIVNLFMKLAEVHSKQISLLRTRGIR